MHREAQAAPLDALDAAWLALIDAGRDDGRLVATSGEQARAAERVEIPDTLAPELVHALGRAGIESLYSHQLAALEAARQGNAIVTSGTASGKSLSFNLPVLDDLVRDPHRRALYLYPTKALAQDQARKLSQLRLDPLRHAIYDGDTPRADRPAIRRRSNLVLTNPDMLHVGVLPHHKQWGDFLANLGWVVVDEAHTYRGVFGSHVANVLRRLLRVAGVYGAEPRFTLASATIANPVELAERLVGQPFALVDGDGAPRAGRRIALWNPPVIDEKSMTRRSVLSEAAELLGNLVAEGMRTICFLRSRRGVELILRFTRMRLEDLGRPHLADRIAPYRAGYTPQQRREIEARLASGELLAVVATDALELGIDIGELDAGMCVTFPGTVASLRQMWGRTSPATMPSTSSSAVTRTSSSSDRWRRRSSITRTSGSSSATPSPPRTSGRSGAQPASPGSTTPSRRRFPTMRSSALAGGSAQTRWWRRVSSGAGAMGATCRAGPASPPVRSRCDRHRPTRLRWSSGRRASCSGRLRRSGRSPPCTPGPSTSISDAPTRCASWTSSDAAPWSTVSTATGTPSRRRRQRSI
jgi:superfamily II DNA/RNA helicase